MSGFKLQTLNNIIRFSIVFYFTVYALISHAQENKVVSITIIPTYGDSVIQLDEKYYKLKSGDSIQIETLKFYISGIELWNDNEKVFEENNSFHLIDASIPGSLNLVYTVPLNIKYHKIKFNIGIDSTTNVSGVMGGDLDPTKGMYWTWQSGYINFKLEGKSNICNTRNNEFQFHIGGYQNPFNSLHRISFDVSENKNIDLTIDIKNLINKIDLSNQNQIMSPGKDALLISEIISNSFQIHKP